MKTIMYLSALWCLSRKECHLIYVNIFFCDWCPNMGPDYTQGGESNFLAKVCAARRDIISPISCPPHPSFHQFVSTPYPGRTLHLQSTQIIANCPMASICWVCLDGQWITLNAHVHKITTLLQASGGKCSQYRQITLKLGLLITVSWHSQLKRWAHVM